MNITLIGISNYRNLDGTEVFLSPGMNFLVGDNDVGKSNFLDLLEILFNRRAFKRDDFYDDTKPIQIKLSFTLDNEEIGVFEDYFDPTDSNKANFIAIQDSPDDLIQFYRGEDYESNPIEVHSSVFHRINYIKYNSLRSPKDELVINSDRGAGRFLNYLIRLSLEVGDKNSDVLNSTVLSPIIEKIDTTLTKIKPLRMMGVGIFADQDNQEDLIARVLLLKTGNQFNIFKSGQGVQFSTLIILSILERLIALKMEKRWKDNILITPLSDIPKNDLDTFLKTNTILEESIQSMVSIDQDLVYINLENYSGMNENEKKIKRLFERKGVSIILGLDEPEIHLHPYMQRSLIKYIDNILANKDRDFKDLIYNLLDLDELSGQTIVVSHSPNILLDNYHYIVRFYKSENTIKSISGCQLHFDRQLEKHLLLNFTDIKEAFFSKCVIVVEGDTELGAMTKWTDKYLGDADDLGISVIRAESCNNVKPIVKLLDSLLIPNVSIMDADENNRGKYSDIPNVFFTKGRDFEEDLYDEVYANQPGCEDLFTILNYFDSGLSTNFNNKQLIKISNKYGIEITWDSSVARHQFSDDLVQQDPNLRKAMFLNFLGMDGIKSISMGRHIAQNINSIPSAYRSVMDAAKKKVINI